MTTTEFTTPRRGIVHRARHHAARTRRGTATVVRYGKPEMRTLAKFAVVGGSGYVVNLVVFAIAERLHSGHVLAATLAFLAAVGNNFHWNRRWTFNACGAEAIHRQARRFLIVSAISFVLSLGILELLLHMGMAAVPSQAISIAVAMPFGFVANRLWTFAAPGTLRRHYRAHLARRAERS